MPPLEEEIVEKSASSPIATSCMVIAFLALLGAIAFQILEYGQYRAPLSTAYKDAENPAQDTARADMQFFRAEAKKIVDKNTEGDDAYFGFKEAMGDAGAAGAGSSLLNPLPEGSGGAPPPAGAGTPAPAPAGQPAPEGGSSGEN